MKVMVLGGGGREHVLAWKFASSPRVEEVWCAPGNGGIARDAGTLPRQHSVPSINVPPINVTPINVDSSGGIEEAVQFATEHSIDLTVVGPEAALVLGVVDRFEEVGLRIFGPRKSAARLEGSKCFAKEFLARHGIPTAGFRCFDEAADARRYIEAAGRPLVVKADGLAAGKGVFVAKETDEALAAIDAIMVENRFGSAGDRVVVEDFLPGTEMTLIVLTDGHTVLPLETARDYKPVFNGGRGPNTGGMGSYSPHLPLDDALVTEVLDTIIQPTLEGLREEGIPYCGALYAGLMVTDDGPSLLEYNVRFGDPEIQSILFRLQSDLLDLVEACLDGRLAAATPEWDPRSAVCVIGASAGYPGTYQKGIPVEGIENAEADAAARGQDVKVFVAGAEFVAAGDDGAAGGLVTSGGRVLGVTALGESLEKARETAYRTIGAIRLAGMHRRDDIGVQVISR